MKKRELSEYCSDKFKAYYEEYCFGVSNPRTVYEYAGYINLLCNYLGKDFLDIKESDAGKYRSYMMGRISEGNLTRQTVCVRLSCYKAVGRFISEKDSSGEYRNPFERIKRPELRTDEIKPERIPTMRELDELMSSAKADPTLYLILALATRVAFNVTTIAKIKREHLVQESGKLFIFVPPANEMSSERYVMLPSDVQALMEEYLAKTAEKGEGALFYNKHGNPMTIRNIDSMVAKLIKNCDFKGKYTMKDFRSRALLELVKTGVDPDIISSYTGLRKMRINAFVNSSGLVSGTCPADLVNYQLRTESIPV